MSFIVKPLLNFLYSLRKKQEVNIKRILFLFPSSAVGDTVIETFFIHEVKKLYPKAKLDIAILAPYAVLLENNPDINCIYKMPVSIFKKLFWLATKAFFFRRQKYDLLLDLPHNGYAPFRQIFLYFTNAKKTLSCNTKGYNFITYPLMWTEENKKHITEEVYIKALKLLGAKGPFEVKYNLFIPVEIKNKVQVFLKQHNPNNKKILVFNPEGSKEPRTLTPQKVKEIIALLIQNTTYQIILLSYKNFYKDMPANIAVFHTDNLIELVALIKQAEYVLTTDTGILHIADAFDKPMMVLFSEANIDESPRPYVEYIWGSKNSKTKKLKARYSVNDIDIKEISKCLQDISY